MGVEILILSGARQGEQLALDADEFRAGGSDACDVFFDPADDAAAKGRIALFRRSGEGWSIQNAGNGELLLNQETVSGRTRIRSGDIVRLSDHGPDFSFKIMAPRSAARADSAAEKTTLRPPRDETTTAMQADDVLQSGVTAESNLAPIVSPGRSRRRIVTIAAMVGLGALALLIILAVGIFGPADDGGTVADANNTTIKHNQESHPQPPPPGVEPPNTSPVLPRTANTSQTATPPTDTADPTPTDPWTRIARQYEKTVWLLEVGDPAGKFLYPFATASAVGRQTLLTTAAVAEELKKFSARGWKVRARNADLKKTVLLDKIRLHGLYAAFGDNPQKKIYVDLAVLTTRQPLPAVAPMATAVELARLDTGAELACMGIAHEGDAIKTNDQQRRDALVPELIGGKLFLRTQFDPQSPSSPRLLHLKASPPGNLPGNLYGSPIIDRQGKIVAVYAEAAAIGPDNQLRLHYAPMIDPALIELALSGKDTKYWVTTTETSKKEPSGNNSNGNKAR